MSDKNREISAFIKIYKTLLSVLVLSVIQGKMECFIIEFARVFTFVMRLSLKVFFYNCDDLPHSTGYEKSVNGTRIRSL